MTSHAEFPSILPEDFLTSPSPNLTVSRIDFTQTSLPENEGRYAVLLDNVLSPQECETLIRAAEATSPEKGWERAMVNIGGGRQMLIEDNRNCGRIIWDSPEMVDRIWKRIEHVPEVQEIKRLENVPGIFGNGPAKWREVWRFTRPNERMRFLKYVGGEYFRPHCDGSYVTPDGKERSYFTMHLYLNDAGTVTEDDLKGMSAKERKTAVSSVLVGGATTFHAWDMKRKYDVMPKAGRILLFQHRDLIHSGDDVVSGVKYTMRTDLMYTVDSTTKAKVQGKWRAIEVEQLKEDEEGTDGLAEAQQYGLLM